MSADMFCDDDGDDVFGDDDPVRLSVSMQMGDMFLTARTYSPWPCLLMMVMVVVVLVVMMMVVMMMMVMMMMMP